MARKLCSAGRGRSVLGLLVGLGILAAQVVAAGAGTLQEAFSLDPLFAIVVDPAGVIAASGYAAIAGARVEAQCSVHVLVDPVAAYVAPGQPVTIWAGGLLTGVLAYRHIAGVAPVAGPRHTAAVAWSWLGSLGW